MESKREIVNNYLEPLLKSMGLGIKKVAYHIDHHGTESISIVYAYTEKIIDISRSSILQMIYDVVYILRNEQRGTIDP